jgi:hypothetical protein
MTGVCHPDITALKMLPPTSLRFRRWPGRKEKDNALGQSEKNILSQPRV